MSLPKHLPVVFNPSNNSYSGAGGKGGGSKPKLEKDSLFSRDHLEAVLGFGEGVFYGLVDGLNSVKFNDEPLAINNKIDIKDIYLSWRMGYEDDAPIEYFLRGENSIISSQQKMLTAGFVESYSTQPSLRGQIRYIQLRLIIQALLKGDDKGNQYKSSVAFLIRYKAVTENDSYWRYVTTSTNNSNYKSLMIDSAKAYAADEGLDWDSLSIQEKNDIIEKSENIVNDYEGTVIEQPATSTIFFIRGFGNTIVNRITVSNQKNNSGESVNGTSYNEDQVYIISGKTSSGYVHELTLPVPPLAEDDWVVEVMKVTPEYPLSEQYSRRTVGISEVSAILAEYRQYPRTVLAHIVAPYDNQFDSIGDISAEFYCRIIDIPTNYNGFEHSYNENDLWLGTYKKGWSNNNVWVLREVLMNPDWGKRRYEPNIMIDDASFYKWAKYCDVRLDSIVKVGAKVYRHTYNDVVTDIRDLDSFIKYICSSFRGSLSERNGVYYLTVDTAMEARFFVIPEMISDVGYTYAKTELNTRWNQVRVAFQNEELDYTDDFRILSDAASIQKYGLITGEVQPIGCTDLSQAIRHAAYALLTNSRETTLVSFQLPRIGLFLNKFDTFILCDPAVDWGYSARIESYTMGFSNIGYIKLRYPAGLPNGSQIKCMVHNHIGIIHYNAIIHDEFTIHIDIGVYGHPPLDADMPIAYYLPESDNRPREFRILNIEDEGTGDALLYTVEASIIYSQKYSRVNNFSNLDPEIKFSSETFERVFNRVDAPTNLRLRIIDFASKNGSPLYRINFEEVANATSYEATWYYSEEDGSKFTQLIYSNNSNLYPAMPDNNVPISLELVAISADGKRSRPSYLLRYIPKLMSAEDIDLTAPISSYGFYKSNGVWFFHISWKYYNPSIINNYTRTVSTLKLSANPDKVYISGSLSGGDVEGRIVDKSNVFELGTSLIDVIGKNELPLDKDFTLTVTTKFEIKGKPNYYDSGTEPLIASYGETPTKVIAPVVSNIQIKSDYNDSTGNHPVPSGSVSLAFDLLLPDADTNLTIRAGEYEKYSLEIMGETDVGVIEPLTFTTTLGDFETDTYPSLLLHIRLEGSKATVLTGKSIKVRHINNTDQVIPFKSDWIEFNY